MSSVAQLSRRELEPLTTSLLPGEGGGGEGRAEPPLCIEQKSELTTCTACDTVSPMDMQSNLRMLAVRVDEDLYSLIKSAAHKREMSIAQFVREMLKAAAEHYVKP